LVNQALPQADSLFKAAIKLIQEVPPKVETDGQLKSTEEPLIGAISRFMSLLVAIPGHPEQGPFYLVKGLLKVIGAYPWEAGSTAKVRLHMNALSLLASYQQTRLPYHIKGVDSNDVLYGGDPDYLAELQAIISKILEEILQSLTDMPGKSQSKLALDLFNYTLAFAELNAKSATLAVNLFSLAKKEGEAAYLNQSLSYLKGKESNLARELLKKLQA